MVDGVQEMVDGSRFRYARRQLVSMFSPARETSLPPYTEVISGTKRPRQAPFKRPDSLTLPMYAGYRKHVGAQIVEGAVGLPRVQVIDEESQTHSCT